MREPTRSFSDADIKGPAGRPLDHQVKLVVPPGGPQLFLLTFRGLSTGPATTTTQSNDLRYHNDLRPRRRWAHDGGGPTTEVGPRRRWAHDGGGPRRRWAHDGGGAHDGGAHDGGAHDGGGPTTEVGPRRRGAHDGGGPTTEGGAHERRWAHDGGVAPRRREGPTTYGGVPHDGGGGPHDGGGAHDGGGPTTEVGPRRRWAHDGGGPTTEGGAHDRGGPTTEVGPRRRGAHDGGGPTTEGGAQDGGGPTTEVGPRRREGPTTEVGPRRREGPTTEVKKRRLFGGPELTNGAQSLRALWPEDDALLLGSGGGTGVVEVRGWWSAGTTWPPLQRGNNMAAAAPREQHGRRCTAGTTWPPLHRGNNMAAPPPWEAPTITKRGLEEEGTTWPPPLRGNNMAAAAAREQHGPRLSAGTTWPPLQRGKNMAAAALRKQHERPSATTQQVFSPPPTRPDACGPGTPLGGGGVTRAFLDFR
ncbi:unnamed protein product [Boreogadus saida]